MKEPSFTPLRAMHLLGMDPDPWQVQVLETTHKRLLLNCARQAGKSTVVAVLALVEALCNPMHKVLIVSRSLRQARELYRQCLFFHEVLRGRLRHRVSQQELVLKNFSRIVCLPCKEETIRGFAKVNLLILDEAARVPDDLYRAVRPMLAVSGGRLMCLSTPYGKRGFFWKEWSEGGDEWLRIEVPAAQVPRIPKEFLQQERRALGEAWFQQEYGCQFSALEGLVFPGLDRCVVEALPASVQARLAHTLPLGMQPIRETAISTEEAEKREERRRLAEQWRRAWGPSEDGDDDLPPWLRAPRTGAVSGHAHDSTGDCVRLVGGIDFGFRNPFAAVWGALDAENVLWLAGEHYQRQRPLSYHMGHLPRNVDWHADPAGAGEIAELRQAGFVIRRGKNELRMGIATVNARIENGGLKILAGRCPQLLHEGQLYRYGDAREDRRAETPVDEHNHALAALRYLVSRLPVRRTALAA